MTEMETESENVQVSTTHVYKCTYNVEAYNEEKWKKKILGIHKCELLGMTQLRIISYITLRNISYHLMRYLT